MAAWKQFEDEAPDLAALIWARFEAAETHVLATLRKDGSPRVSGSEVAFLGPDWRPGHSVQTFRRRYSNAGPARTPGGDARWMQALLW